MMNMPKIVDCNAGECAYNKEGKCHAIGITVGGSEEPMCDTFWNNSRKGGALDMVGGVGACKVENCAYNQSFECGAKGISVQTHMSHADCATFKQR